MEAQPKLEINYERTYFNLACSNIGRSAGSHNNR